MTSSNRQFTLAQLAAHGISPDTTLGQHFLVDDNVLGVIERLSGITAADVVYEVGAGVGVLTRRLASRCAFVHAAELDQRLASALDAAVADFDNVAVHWGDALRLAPASFTPRPTAMVANLPYNVASPLVAETLQRARHIVRFCVMLQREVADRLFAPTSAANYGALSVLVQATCARSGAHRVSRHVFAPPPNVDSTIIAFQRYSASQSHADAAPGLAPAEVPRFASFVRHAFAHRRKTLSNNLCGRSGLNVLPGPITRIQLGALLKDLGLPPDARPQAVSPEHFIQLWHALSVTP